MMEIKFKVNLTRLDSIFDYKYLDSRKYTINPRREYYCETESVK